MMSERSSNCESDMARHATSRISARFPKPLCGCQPIDNVGRGAQCEWKLSESTSFMKGPSSMRYTLAFGLGAISAILVVPSAHGQQPYWAQRGASSAANVAARGDQGDALRAYSSARGSAAVAAAANSSSSRETEVASAGSSRSGSSAQQRRSYFPGMRAGQGPNHNYVPPERLCSPGRRAYMYGALNQQLSNPGAGLRASR
jgi:hypothetical protein